jgi:tRNA threonylcarbamoyl adenosine modification protein (Sua5/YciO/YrdC/YwlC family)
VKADERALDVALEALAAGTVVAAATESSFGLLADASSPRAVSALLALKPRANDKGMPLILPSQLAWSGWVRPLPPLAERLAAAFWPGPLTIALDAAPEVDERLLLDGRVAVRVPKASAAAELARRFGRALTATSANPPGHPPANTDAEVQDAFASEIATGALVVVPGAAPAAPPSTVIIVSGDRLHIARLGAISAEQIERVSTLPAK